MAQRIIPRVYRGYFEYLYARKQDPWDYETRSYEITKYERTLEALEGRRFARALEVGCSIGVFTELLATRCEELVAVDASALAVRRARRRLAGHPHVRVRRCTLPEQMPGGRFDLVVCSEVLYYWNRELLREALRAMEEALAPGGVLLAVHGRFESHTCPLTGDEVHDLLHGHSTLRNALSVREHKYRLDRFERPSRPPGHAAHPPVPRQRTGRESTHPDAGSRTRGNSSA